MDREVQDIGYGILGEIISVKLDGVQHPVIVDDEGYLKIKTVHVDTNTSNGEKQ